MRSRTRHRKIGLWVLILLAAPFVIDVVIVTDEERIQQLVERAVEAVEAADAAALAEMCSPHFEDRSGKLRDLARSGAESAIAAMLRPFEEISLSVQRREVEVDGDRARLDLETLVAAEGPFGRIPFVVELVATLEKDPEGEWRFLGVDRLEPRPAL